MCANETIDEACSIRAITSSKLLGRLTFVFSDHLLTPSSGIPFIRKSEGIQNSSFTPRVGGTTSSAWSNAFSLTGSGIT